VLEHSQVTQDGEDRVGHERAIARTQVGCLAEPRSQGGVGGSFQRHNDGQGVHDRGEALGRQLRIGPFPGGQGRDHRAG